LKRSILLVEPGYKNKYPPLGLMKIATYHKLIGDHVRFVKGCDESHRRVKWDRIYVSTLFTFHWDITVKTINYYKSSAPSAKDVFVGGVLATLMESELVRETGIRVISGLIDKPGILDSNKLIVDKFIPDYSILDDTNYVYGLQDAYIAYATRGCPNKCSFCAVNLIEPIFRHYLPIKNQIQSIDNIYGPRQNLVLLDNNVLASNSFEKIISDIIDLGFEKEAIFNGKKRTLDFNQGIDIRLLDNAKMGLLSKTSIKPLRLAFDHIELKEIYSANVLLAHTYGLDNLSNYVLFNYMDKPRDFYERLRINVELNEELGTKIYSFPMKYVPLNAKDRTFVGKHWNKRILRGIQCILLATKGKVGTKKQFFEAAFGRSYDEFVEIAMMPEEFIIHRRAFNDNGAKEWRSIFRGLSNDELSLLAKTFSKGKESIQAIDYSYPDRLRRLAEIELYARSTKK